MDSFPSKRPVSNTSSVPLCTYPPVDRVLLHRPSSSHSWDDGSYNDNWGKSKANVLEVGDLAALPTSSNQLRFMSTTDQLCEQRVHERTPVLNISEGHQIKDFDVLNYNTVVIVSSGKAYGSLGQLIVQEVAGSKPLATFVLNDEPEVVRVLSDCLIAVGMTSGAVKLFKWAELKLTCVDFPPGTTSNPRASTSYVSAHYNRNGVRNQRDPITSISGDDNRVLTISSNGLVEIWDFAAFRCWTSFRFSSFRYLLGSMGSNRFLICVSRDTTSSTSVYNADTCKLIVEIDHECRVISVILSSKEDRFITFEESKSDGHTISVFETDTGERKWCWKWSIPNALESEKGAPEQLWARLSLFSEGRIGLSNCQWAEILRPPVQVATQLDRGFFKGDDTISQLFPPLQSGLIRVLMGTASPMSIVAEHIRQGQRVYSLPEWFGGHCLMMLVGFELTSNRSKAWKNARDFYRSPSLDQFKIKGTEDFCIVRRCIQEAVHLGLAELSFCPKPQHYVTGPVRQLRPAFVALFRQFMSPVAMENRLRQCLERFHQHAEPFQLVGISIQIIALVHKTELKKSPVPVSAEEAASEIHDQSTVARLIADLLLGIPLHRSEAKTSNPVPFIRRIMNELHGLQNAEAVEMRRSPKAEGKQGFLAQIGLVGDQLELLLSDWYEKKYHQATPDSDTSSVL